MFNTLVMLITPHCRNMRQKFRPNKLTRCKHIIYWPEVLHSVYKRNKHNWLYLLCKSQILNVSTYNLRCSPVSYTHLDVYKRQPCIQCEWSHGANIHSKLNEKQKLVLNKIMWAVAGETIEKLFFLEAAAERSMTYVLSLIHI